MPSPPSLSRAEKKLTPKGERARHTILQAAAELFGQRGYDSTGIRDIEDAAGVSRGTVTYHLGNKEEIWKAVIDFVFVPILRGMESNRSFLMTLAPAARERNLISQFTRISARNPHMNRLMIQEGFRDTWRNAFIVERFLSPLSGLLSGLAEGSALIRLLNEDPHVRYIILGSCNMVFSLPTEVSALFHRDVYEDAFIDRHIDTVISMLEGFAGAADDRPSADASARQDLRPSAQ